MENVREFWLENQDKQLWHFTSEESETFMEDPQGLGLDINYGGFRLGNAEIVNTQQYQLKPITGVLNFFGSNRAEIYKNYFDFMNFIAKNRLLKLHYRTPNTFESYYRYCFVQSVTKTEIDDRYLLMECPITFATQTFWRNDKVNSIAVTDESTGDGKKYELERPYHYASSKLSNIKVINRGNTDTAMKVTILGASKNPTLNVYDNNGVRYGAIRMLGEFDKVIIDSDDLNQSITLEKEGATLTAPYAYQDLSVGQQNQVYVTFVKLKSGESTLVFTNDGAFDGIVMIEWSDEYVSI